MAVHPFAEEQRIGQKSCTVAEKEQTEELRVDAGTEKAEERNVREHQARLQENRTEAPAESELEHSMSEERTGVER